MLAQHSLSGSASVLSKDFPTMQDSSYEVVKEPEKPSPRGWVALAKDYVFDPKNSLMFLLLLALIIVGTANRVMFKKM